MGIESAEVLGFYHAGKGWEKNKLCSFLPKSFQERTAVRVSSVDRDGFLSQISVSRDLGFSSRLDTANHPCQVECSQVTVRVSNWSSEVLTFMSMRTLFSFQGLNIQVTKGTDVFGVHLIYTSHGSVLKMLNVFMIYHWLSSSFTKQVELSCFQ